MTQLANELIATFDHLPLSVQAEVTRVLLKRHVDIETPDLSDDDLVFAAEDIFLELDRRESQDAGA